MPSVYIETTIISYLTARPSRDLIVAAHQQLTQDWWENRRAEFNLFVSELVIRESRAGDPQAAERRLNALQQIPLLELNGDVLALAYELVEKGPLSRKAAEDALHIAVAAVYGIDYLLTWNSKHIANAEMRGAIAEICRSRGYEPPIICTPEELMGG
jgi:predicted nucleic acid-binding protein